MAGPFSPFTPSPLDLAAVFIKNKLAEDSDLVALTKGNIVRRTLPLATDSFSGVMVWVGLDSRGYAVDARTCPEGVSPLLIGIQWTDTMDTLADDEASIDAVAARIVQIAYANQTCGGIMKRIERVRTVGYEQVAQHGDQGVFYSPIFIDWRAEADMTTGDIGP